MDRILTEDINEFVNNSNYPPSLGSGRWLVTGATGLIGASLVHYLLAYYPSIEIFCPLRNLRKAKTLFTETEAKRLHLIECNLEHFLDSDIYDYHFDYIVHCASPTSGQYMIGKPVETFSFIVCSTEQILRYALQEHSSVVFLSSLEVYGQIFGDQILPEESWGFVCPNAPRSSYPMAKRAAEYLCSAYAKEFGVDAKIARLTQVLGPGVANDDNRVFAQFARSVIHSTDIVLHTEVRSAKPYCYTADCVAAILTILLKGSKGEAYNVANEKTYISIRDMANFMVANFNQNIVVREELHLDYGYAPETKLHLSTSKLRALGWEPYYDLRSMLERLIISMKEQQ